MKHFSVDTEQLGQAIQHLRDSFLIQTNGNHLSTWTYKHPTIADALSATLGKTEGLAELYIRGTKAETLLAQVACSGVMTFQDVIVVPVALEGLLIERLAELPDELSLNRQLLSFLDTRASIEFLRKFVERHPDMIARHAILSEKLAYDPTICVRARVNVLGLLAPELKDEAEAHLTAALVDDADTSFLDNDDIFALIRPTKLLRVASSIRDEVLGNFAQLIENVADNADLDIEPGDNFNDLQSKLNDLAEFFADDPTATDPLRSAASSIDDAIEELKKQKERREKAKLQDEEDDWNWKRLAPGTPVVQSATTPEVPAAAVSRPRSIFGDVDE